MAGKKAEIIPRGTQFGRYTVVHPAESHNRHPYYLVWCDCGTLKEVSRVRLLDGTSTSCGCARDEMWSILWTKHGEARTKLYKLWAGIIARCYNENNKGYGNYGGRGIKMSDEWRNSFEAFKKDMGERPVGKSIERVDVNGDYCKDNCTWATSKEQGRNRRNSKKYLFRGEYVTIDEARELTGVSIARSSVNQRLKRGMGFSDALLTPQDPKKRAAGLVARHK